MKKLLAAMLAAMLLCCSAFAEESLQRLNENSDALAFYLAIPNGMAMEQTAYDPGVIGTVEIAGMPDLMVFFSLMPDDSYTDLDMSELSEDEVKALASTMTDDLGESTSEAYDMPCGLKAMLLRDIGNTEYIAMTLKDGYFFYVEGFHADFSPLTDEEAQAVKAVFDSLSFTEQ